MKAIACVRYGAPEVLEMREMEKPKPKADEVLVKIHASTVTSGDCRMRSASTPAGLGWVFRLAIGIRRPRKPILGTEIAGEVEAVGEKVTKFRKGDAVFAFTGAAGGGYAEYACVPERGAIAKKPVNATYEEAAAISFGATTALYFLRELAKLQKGEKILINGAAGGIGTSAIQLAKHFGAEVTGVCSGANVELVRSLGADRVIDYTKEDPAHDVERYDVIFDTVGHLAFTRCKRLLKERGRYLNAAAGLPDFMRMLWTSFFGKKKVLGGVAPERAEDLEYLKELMEAGKLRVVVDRFFPLQEVVEAHRYVDQGHKRGNVVLRIGGLA